MRAKPTLIALAVLAGVVAIALAGALSPSVQTRAARWALSSPSWKGTSIDRLTCGLKSQAVDGLRVERRGMVLLAPRIEADLELVPAALGRGYHFNRLVAHGWTLDLSDGAGTVPAPAEAAGGLPARALGGALAAFDLQGNLALTGVDLEGDVLFPDENGRRGGKVHVLVTGGGLSPGGSGRFVCTAAASLDDTSAPVSRVSVSATLTAAADLHGVLTRADLKADLLASGQGVPAGIGLSVAASAAHDAGKNACSLSLTRGSEAIAQVDALHPDGSATLSGTWRLNLKDSDLTPFALGRSLPVFYVAGSGSVEVDTSSGDAHAAGKLQATANRLGVLGKDLSALGRITLSADFDVARLGDSLRVARLDTSLGGASQVASVRALQSFEFNTTTGELRVAVPSGDLVGISITELPLAWFRAALRGTAVEGGGVSGEFVMRAEDGRLALRTKAPLTASGVTVSRGKKVIADGLGISAFVLADYAAQGWQVQLAPLSVRSDGLKLLSLEVRFGRLAGSGRAIKAAGSWSASLPALLAEPAASGLVRLSAGEASGSFEANLDQTSEVRLKLQIRDMLLATDPGVRLPEVESEIRADFEPGGRTSFSVPLRLDYGARAAEIALKGSVSSDAAGPVLDATLEGSQVTAEEIGALLHLSRGGDPPEGPPSSAPVPRRPFWPEIRGTLALRFEGVTFPKLGLGDLRGTLRMDPTALAIESGTATLSSGGTARLDGRLVFEPAETRPLSFTANLALASLDSGALFRSIDPSRPPLVDGRFDCEGQVGGRGTSPKDLLEAVQGDVKLVSKLGTFRALHADAIDQIRQAPSKLVGAIDTVSSLFGKKVDKLGQALVESANAVSEIHYDQLELSAHRGEDLDVKLTAINLISPEVRITGSGFLAHAAGVSLQDQPLSVDLDLAVRGNLGKFMDVVGLVSDDRDSLGYSKLVQPVHLGGTLRAVDPGQWKDMLIQASLKKGGGLFDKLLGR